MPGLHRRPISTGPPWPATAPSPTTRRWSAAWAGSAAAPWPCSGTEKGSDTESRVKHNFGMARPEGYRKARRLIELAGRFGLPMLSFVDTSGAFPGIEAEARGQAEAIARSIEACLDSAGALRRHHHRRGRLGRRHRPGRRRPGADARARDLFGDLARGLRHILWRDQAQAATAAEALRLTAEDLRRLNLVDGVMPEPMGGAHRDAATTLAAVGDRSGISLSPLLALDGATLSARRREKFLAMGRNSVV